MESRNINILEVSDISDFRANKVHFFDWYKVFSFTNWRRYSSISELVIFSVGVDVYDSFCTFLSGPPSMIMPQAFALSDLCKFLNLFCNLFFQESYRNVMSVHLNYIHLHSHFQLSHKGKDTVRQVFLLPY